jgi:hypothetical protein
MLSYLREVQATHVAIVFGELTTGLLVEKTGLTKSQACLTFRTLMKVGVIERDFKAQEANGRLRIFRPTTRATLTADAYNQHYLRRLLYRTEMTEEEIADKVAQSSTDSDENLAILAECSPVAIALAREETLPVTTTYLGILVVASQVGITENVLFNG